MTCSKKDITETLPELNAIYEYADFCESARANVKYVFTGSQIASLTIMLILYLLITVFMLSQPIFEALNSPLLPFLCFLSVSFIPAAITILYKKNLDSHSDLVIEAAREYNRLIKIESEALRLKPYVESKTFRYKGRDFRFKGFESK